jgi:hypothetical protein
MSPAVCPLSAPSANHRIDPTGQIDRNGKTTPDQQAPSARSLRCFYTSTAWLAQA